MEQAAELWQAYNEQGEPSGQPLQPDEAMRGVLHGSSHVWVWRRRHAAIELMLQKRALTKRTWAGYLDISAAGHINFGETPLQAAIRETSEEIGVRLISDDVRLLTVHRQYLVDPTSRAIENELQWVYGYELAGSSELQFAEDEVERIEWFSLTDFQSLVDTEYDDRKIVPHGPVYFAELMKELHKIVRP